MEYRHLGSSGLQVSLVGLGCNNFGRRCNEAETARVVHAALDRGINFFDTADIYGPHGLSESFLGKALTGRDRSSVVIATKFANQMEQPWQRGASRRHIRNKALGTLHPGGPIRIHHLPGCKI